ncbi:hypothetical protein IQ283_20130 [Alkalihalobacillus hwajinpoensis]|uniref:hypothetical protein n=1 Tax=Guptibacillus hwajinpoensis TaxID=208199 RepID=UPI0018840E1A|nr:hypothetical protein [Pseudalkalibacillus hwajinpoensis]MBF0708914.1 hypothetical protein [Pseudalkalibacillus hwajinpoensis]
MIAAPHLQKSFHNTRYEQKVSVVGGIENEVQKNISLIYEGLMVPELNLGVVLLLIPINLS